MPEGPPFYELEDEGLVEMPSPRGQQRLVFKLAGLLDEWTKRHRLCADAVSMDIALTAGRGYIPDLAFLCREQEGEILAPDREFHGVLHSVVEVISPTTKTRDQVQMKGYFEAGVECVWLIDGKDLSIEDFKGTPFAAISGEVFEPKAFSGLKLNLAQLSEKTTNQASRRGKK